MEISVRSWDGSPLTKFRAQTLDELKSLVRSYTGNADLPKLVNTEGFELQGHVPLTTQMFAIFPRQTLGINLTSKMPTFGEFF